MCESPFYLKTLLRKKLLLQHIDFLVPYLPEANLASVYGGKNMAFDRESLKVMFSPEMERKKQKLPKLWQYLSQSKPISPNLPPSLTGNVLMLN